MAGRFGRQPELQAEDDDLMRPVRDREYREQENLGQDHDDEMKNWHMDGAEPDSYDEWDEDDGALTSSNLSKY